MCQRQAIIDGRGMVLKWCYTCGRYTWTTPPARDSNKKFLYYCEAGHPIASWADKILYPVA